MHLGLGRESHDVSATMLQSDTMSAALASLRAMQGRGDSTEKFLESFTLSSAFPYDGEEYFLPRMSGRLSIKVEGQEEEQYRKKLKKLQFVSEPLWRRLVCGESITVDEGQLQGEFLLAKANPEFEKPMKHLAMQRVTVPRDGGQNATPFVFDWTFFSHGKRETGLYCLLQADGEEVRQEVVSLFHELGQTGIGADKSVGGGRFDVETEDVEIREVDHSNRLLLLSTYIPSDEDLKALNLLESDYQLLKRSGFMAGSNREEHRHLRRNSIYMFDVGSVMATRQHVATLQGQIVDLRPQWDDAEMHPVLRSGRALAIHIK